MTRGEPVKTGCAPSGREIALKAAEIAVRLRHIRGSLPDHGLEGERRALRGLEKELLDMIGEVSCLEPGEDGQSSPLDGALCGGSHSISAMEKFDRTRRLVRFILHFFSMQVQAGQRAASYSKQDSLDDMESLLETLLEWLSTHTEEDK